MADLASLPAATKARRSSMIRTLLIHLRLHYQILLAPIFLWGYFLAGGYPNSRFWLAFLAFHLFLYGGTTAFNSYYDRDTGPVGGLIRPPPVIQALLPFSLIMQAIGFALALQVNLTFAVLYLIIFCMGFAYSHPQLRWKARPLGGLLTVGIGQGLLAALGGWSAANPDLTLIQPLAWVALLAASLITVGFYPLTQIYQIEEDLARGDLTFAAWVGPRGVFRYTLLVLGLAAVLLIFVINRELGLANALIVGTFYVLLLGAIAQWAIVFDNRRVLANYRRVMRIHQLTSLGFLGFISLHLFGVL